MRIYRLVARKFITAVREKPIRDNKNGYLEVDMSKNASIRHGLAWSRSPKQAFACGDRPPTVPAFSDPPNVPGSLSRIDDREMAAAASRAFQTAVRSRRWDG
jgi:hypothetical protein